MTQTPTDALRLVLVPYVVLSEAAGLLDCEGYEPLALTLNNLLAAAPASPLPTERDPILSSTELADSGASPLPEGGGNMDWQSVAMWMGFSASVIKNGEPWSDQCQQHYDEARAAFARLAAPTGDA